MNARARLRKKLAQDAWDRPAGKRKHARKANGSTRKYQKSAFIESPRALSSLSRVSQDETFLTDIDEEAVPYTFPVEEELGVEEEEYLGKEDSVEEGGYSASDYGIDAEEEFGEKGEEEDSGNGKEGLSETLYSPEFLSPRLPKEAEMSIGKPSEYRLYTTELGETFRVRPSRNFRGDGGILHKEAEKYMDAGIDRDQHTLHMDEHPGYTTITRRPLAWTQITEDGYLDPSDRDDPNVAPYSVEYVQELLRRKDILRSHPDYEFLSQFASHLSLLPEDVFVEESVTRKQAAASALLEAVTARQQARGVQLEALGKRMENLDTSRMIKESQLRRVTKDLPPNSAILRDAQRTWVNYQRQDDNITQANRFNEYLAILRMMAPSATTDADIIAIRDDGNLMDHVEHYLTVLSPNSAFALTKRVVRHYKRYKRDPNIGSNIRLAFFLYSVWDFYTSLGATFARRMFPGAGFIKPETIPTGPPPPPQIPRRRGLGWNAIDITILPSNVDPDDRGILARFPAAGDEADRFASVLLSALLQPRISTAGLGTAALFGPAIDVSPLFSELQNGEYLKGPDDFTGTTAARRALIQGHTTLLRNHYRALGDLFAANDLFGPNGEEFSIYDFINQLVGSTNQDIARFTNERGNSLMTMYNLLQTNRTIRSSIQALELEDELQDVGTMVVTTGAPVPEVADFIRKWLDAFTREVNRLNAEIQDIRTAGEQIEERIDTLRRTGRAPGESEIDVPFRTSLEWALKPINTGRVEIAPWALAAINSGHSAFKIYVARGRTSRWKDIDRNIIQRDELMGPLFAEFCATFVNKAKIANPRRYMHVSAGRDLMMRKASILKSMVTDLRYVPPKKQFVPQIG
jgi:hypothetical protein